MFTYSSFKEQCATIKILNINSFPYSLPVFYSILTNFDLHFSVWNIYNYPTLFIYKKKEGKSIIIQLFVNYLTYFTLLDFLLSQKKIK